MAIGRSKLHDLLRRRRLISDAVIWFDTFDVSMKVKILDMIREDQLRSKGIDGTGEVIGYYSLTTSLINPLKRFNTHYTLYDTGAFFRSMFVTVLADRLQIDAESNKGDEDLFEKFGTKIIALTDENFERLKKDVRQKYIEAVRSALFRR